MDADAARNAAEEGDAERAAGRLRGPLHGVPYAVKDHCDVAGLPTRANARLTTDTPAKKDSAVVARLRDAGAICLGKLSTWEYGTGNGGEFGDLLWPTTRNPWDVERFAGGSSTGAGTAVMAGMLPMAFGSDTTGSVRLPASATGAVGLKPTPGAIPKNGILANCYSLDVPGPFGQRVADVAFAFGPGAERRASPRFDTTGDSLSGLRIGVFAEHGPGMDGPDPAMVEAFENGLRRLERLGARLVPLNYPVSCAEALAVASTIGMAESSDIHEAELADHADALGFALRDKLMAGAMIRAADYLADVQSSDRPTADLLRGLDRGVAGLQIGVLRVLGDDAEPAQPEIMANMEGAVGLLAEQGAVVETVSLPVPVSAYRQFLSIINRSESFSIHEEDFMQRHHLMGEALRGKMMAGFMVRAVDYIAAQRQRRSLAKSTDAMMAGFDAIITPTTRITAPPFVDQQAVVRFTASSVCAPFSISGHPAMALPTGFDAAGLPTSAQIVGHYFDEATIYRVARALDHAMPTRSRPAL